MFSRSVFILLLILLTKPIALAGDATELWARRVQPLLDIQCTKCHGLIERKGGLQLDHPDEIFKGGNEGPVVVPGKPEQSRLYTYLAADSDPHMPPKKQLSQEQREVLREWIVALAEKPKEKQKPAKAVTERNFKSGTEAADVLLSEAWRDKIKPAAAVDDRTWTRRVYLDLAGRIPTQPELDELLNARSKNKRAELVDRLMASDEYAVHMRELWDVLLMGRPKRGNGEERRKENGWWAFLENSFRTNRPWNETVREILIARPRAEEKGATWFLYERRNDHQAIAEAVSPVVYGTRIDCAQCHDHPLAREIKQAHYWGLVAAFNRSKNVERGQGTDVSESAIGGFVNFTNLKKESQPAVMAMLTGRTIEEKRATESGDKEKDNDEFYVDAKAKVRVPKFSRRAEFAKAATENNPLLARAFVNRMWAVLLGRGFVHPADEINERNAPSHPELLEWLTKDFEASNYDVRRLVRGIVLSRAYGLGSTREAPEKFAGALERPLSAEQIARSWRVGAGLAPNDDELRRKVIAALPDVMPKEYNATFQQAQFLTYSPAVAELLKQASTDGAVAKLATLKTAEDRARGAFLAVYGRAPDREELAQTTAFLKSRPDKPAEGARDLLWALMTSAEFLTMP